MIFLHLRWMMLLIDPKLSNKTRILSLKALTRKDQFWNSRKIKAATLLQKEDKAQLSRKEQEKNLETLAMKRSKESKMPLITSPKFIKLYLHFCEFIKLNDTYRKMQVELMV